MDSIVLTRVSLESEWRLCERSRGPGSRQRRRARDPAAEGARSHSRTRTSATSYVCDGYIDNTNNSNLTNIIEVVIYKILI